jgi:eukaryotic-like serine/threonine-protein kinase
LYTSLALLPVDESQLEYLYQQLLKVGPVELPVIGTELRGHKEALVGRLWAVLENEQADAGQRFRAACTLADYDVTEDEANRNRWQAVAPFVADRLLAAVQQNPDHYTPLRRTLNPLRERLVGPLSEVFRSGQRPETDRSWASSILADYAAERPEVLAGLLLDADAKQFAVLWPKVEAQRERAAAVCQATMDTSRDTQKTEKDKERLAKRQANAGVALLRLGRGEKVWPLLQHPPRPDPRARSYLIHYLAPLGAKPEDLVQRLEVEPDVSIRRALLLSLGEFTPQQWPPAAREALLPRLWQLYREHPDPGIHGAAEWLLRQWQQQDQLKEAEQQWLGDEQKPKREQRLAAVTQVLAKVQGARTPQWYVTGQGQTMVVIPGPVQFLMGSPTTEAGREDGPEGKLELQHKRRIGRSFAIAAKTVRKK